MKVRQMRIICIGPVKPLRGGIAHSNEIMCRNLARKNKVAFVSFSRLFPKILYPGKSSASGNEKNTGTLDSVNPLNWIREREKISAQNLYIPDKPCRNFSAIS